MTVGICNLLGSHCQEMSVDLGRLAVDFASLEARIVMLEAKIDSTEKLTEASGPEARAFWLESREALKSIQEHFLSVCAIANKILNPRANTQE